MPKGIDVNAKAKDERTALHEAAGNGKWKAVQALLKDRRVHVNAADSVGSTALHWAAENGEWKAVRALLDDDRIEINAANNFGLTALHEAAKYDDEDYKKRVGLLKGAGAK